ncbi:hypothetical protein D3M71_22325 [Erwinia billingiae]|nr:hypothetical protein [Erwinia billingiae]
MTKLQHSCYKRTIKNSMMHKSYGDTLSPKHKLCNIDDIYVQRIRYRLPTSYDQTGSLTTAKRSTVVPTRPAHAPSLCTLHDTRCHRDDTALFHAGADTMSISSVEDL